MAKAFYVKTGVSGAEIWLNYSDSNQRISTVQWTLPASVLKARVQIWNNGKAFYDKTFTGPASGTENVAGNHAMEWVYIWGAYRWMIPSYLTYRIDFEMVGE